VDIELIVFAHSKRQIGKKFSLSYVELATRPVSYGLRLGKERNVVESHAAIMVATQRHCSVTHKFHNGGDNPFRIAAIANIIAQKNETLRAMFVGMRKPDFQRSPVGVNVAYDGYLHTRTC
jgi:hypothetical protein